MKRRKPLRSRTKRLDTDSFGSSLVKTKPQQLSSCVMTSEKTSDAPFAHLSPVVQLALPGGKGSAAGTLSWVSLGHVGIECWVRTAHITLQHSSAAGMWQ